MKLSELLDLHNSARLAQRRLHGALRLLRPSRLDRDAAPDYEALVAANPLIRRFPESERTRMRRESRQEIESRRRTAGAVGRYRAREVRSIVARGRAAIAKARRDVVASMPDALNHLTADGMVSLALLRVQLMPLLRAAGPTELFDVYQSAITRCDPRGYVEAEIIEGLIAAGATTLPTDDTERAAAKQLRQYVEDIQDLRLPTDLPDFEELSSEADRLDSLADAIRLAPLNPEERPGTAEVYEQLASDLEAAAEASGADDVEAAQKQAAAV